MVAPIVPFVVGMLSNLAARKVKHETAEAARSVADYEFGHAKKLKEMEFGNSRYLELIKQGAGSMFSQYTNELMPFNMNNPEALLWLSEQSDKDKYDWGIKKKLHNIKGDVEGAGVTDKAFHWITQLNKFNDADWKYVENNYPTQANLIKSSLIGKVAIIDKEMRQTESGMSEGALDMQLLFGNYSPWLVNFIIGKTENASGKVVNENNVFEEVAKLPPYVADSWTYTNHNRSYNAETDKKSAETYFTNTAHEIAIFHTPVSKKENLNQIKNISPANGKNWMDTYPVHAVGFTQYSEIFLDKKYNNNGELVDVRAKGPNTSVFSDKNLNNAANYIINESFSYADNLLVKGSPLHTMRGLGLHHNYLDAVLYQIDALSSVAGNHDLPGSYVAVGKDRGFATLPLYADGSEILKEQFNLTPTILNGYKELARQGHLAMDNADRQKELIYALDFGGTFLSKAISFYAQAGEFGKKMVSLIGYKTKNFNKPDTTKDINIQLDGIETSLTKLNDQYNSTEDIKERNDISTTMKNLTASKEVLTNWRDSIAGINMNDAYLNLKDFDKDSAEYKSIMIAKLALLRGGLVFYAAAIFQGEGGKAISDGDRELVTRALAVSPFSTRDQALGALDEFSLGMASIIGKAERIGNGTTPQRWAALNYNNVYPALNNTDNDMTRRNLPNSVSWKRGDVTSSFGVDDSGPVKSAVVSDDTSIVFDGTKIDLPTLFDVSKYKDEAQFNATIQMYLDASKEEITEAHKKRIRAYQKELNQAKGEGG